MSAGAGMRGYLCGTGILLLLALIAGATTARAGEEVAPCRQLARGREIRMALEGPVHDYLAAVTQNWLLPAPGANPAILAMFADRDRAPYRDLLPWSGEFAGKYLTGATQVLRATNDPRLRTHLERFVARLIAFQDSDGYLGPFPRDHRLTGSRPTSVATLGPPGTPGATITRCSACCSGTRSRVTPRL